MIEAITDITANPDEVWEVLTDFTHYPAWTSYIQQISGHPEEGFRLRIVMGPPGRRPYNVLAPVLEATPGVRLAWAVVVPGASWLHRAVFHGTHELVLTALPNRSTRLAHREYFGGMLARFAKHGQRDAEEGFEAFNTALKVRVEELADLRDKVGGPDSGF